MNVMHPSIAASSALFPDAARRRAVDDAMTTLLAEARARMADGAVGPTLDMPAFHDALAGFDFATPRHLADLLPWVVEQLEHGIVHLTHPRYCGLFNPQPSFPAECADRIVAAFNPQLATATTSPVPVELEAHVIRAIARRAGLPDSATGHFTTGGSEANFTALICALTRAHAAFGRRGVRAFAGDPMMYVSRDAHVAWFKIAHQAGIGRAAVRVVDTDAAGQMEPGALRAAIAEDRAAGRIPVMIAATAGTTGAGMVDPLHACSRIARDAGLWYHVDAAWGGAVIVSDRLRPLLAGIETADSITIDAHKWLATTMGCGMFLTPHGGVLNDAFHVAASTAPFMPSNARHLDPYVTTAQWSRRFLGLRLFVALAAAGWQGYAAHVERAVDLIATLKAELAARGWTIANSSEMAVLCVIPPAGFLPAAEIARAVVASREGWVASTRFQGRDVVRICVTNGETSPSDMHALADLLHATGQAPAV